MGISLLFGAGRDHDPLRFSGQSAKIKTSLHDKQALAGFVGQVLGKKGSAQ